MKHLIKITKVIQRINGKLEIISPSAIDETNLDGTIIVTASKRKFKINEIK